MKKDLFSNQASLRRDGPLQGELGPFELSSRRPHDGAASKPAN